MNAVKWAIGGVIVIAIIVTLDKSAGFTTGLASGIQRYAGGLYPSKPSTYFQG